MIKFSALFLLTCCFCLSNCQLDERWKTFRERFLEEDLIRDAKLIRDSEKAYKLKFGSYGSMQDLIDAGILSSRFADGEESEAKFVLTNENQHYKLTVTPKVPRSENYSFTLFVADSGAIKFSEDPQKPANPDSDSLLNGN